jgi:FkbM family methyltransferase
MIPSMISQNLIKLGSRISSLGYLLENPSYSQVRHGRGCADIYKLINKKWFPKTDIKIVIDVGANDGQFIRTSLALMPQAKILAFEPNPDSVQKLENGDWDTSNVKILPFALGDVSGNLPLNISCFSPASSLLKTSQSLATEFPEALTETIVIVKIERLDSVIEKLKLDTDLSTIHCHHMLLKIDVQGFELEVLKGATKLFDRIAVIICEVNLAQLYEDQCAFDTIVNFLYKNGFRLIDIGESVRSRNNEEVLYVDLAFIPKV